MTTSKSNRSTIKKVLQKHKSGCGVACVAMILGITYDEAMKIVHPRRRPWKKPKVTIVQYIKTFKKLNLKFTVKLVDGYDLSKIKNPCILGLRWEDDNHKSMDPINGWHAVVFHKKVLDPYSFGKYKPYSLKYTKKHVFVIFEFKMP